MATTFNPTPSVDRELKKMKNKNQGINDSLEGFFMLKKRSFASLKNRFTKPELTGLVDSLNGTMFQTNMATASILMASIEDAIKLDALDDRHGFDGNELLTKLGKLNDFQAYFLMLHISDFWNDADRDLEDFIEGFSPLMNRKNPKIVVSARHYGYNSDFFFTFACGNEEDEIFGVGSCVGSLGMNYGADDVTYAANEVEAIKDLRDELVRVAENVANEYEASLDMDSLEDSFSGVENRISNAQFLYEGEEEENED